MPEPRDPDAAAAAAALRRVTASASPPVVRPPRARGAVFKASGRDPEGLASALDRLLREQGWTEQSAIAVVFSQWEQVVGPELTAHVTPEAFSDGRLTVRAASTAWATQLRLMLPALHRSIDSAAGTGVVRSIVVLGPDAPSWSFGQRRVKGRGPRDTYG
jgi:predicted nucleic acid-binding Zn ribbon protein